MNRRTFFRRSIAAAALAFRAVLDTLNPRLRLPKSATFDHAEGTWEFDRPVARGVRVRTSVSFVEMDVSEIRAVVSAGLRKREFVA